MREYELTCIYRSDAGETAIAKTIEKYEQILARGGGQFLKKDIWGTRKLAYPINKQFRGHFVHYDYVGDKENIVEAERLMNIDDNVLRYLTIKLSNEVNIEARKMELLKPEPKKSEPERSYESHTKAER